MQPCNIADEYPNLLYFHLKEPWKILQANFMVLICNEYRYLSSRNKWYNNSKNFIEKIHFYSHKSNYTHNIVFSTNSIRK